MPHEMTNTDQMYSVREAPWIGRRAGDDAGRRSDTGRDRS
jgi:hypothetical protein